MKTCLLHLSLVATLGMPIAALTQNTFPTSGNVGIGTTEPDANLAIRGSAYSDTESNFVGAHVTNTADGGDASLWLQNSTKNAYIRLKHNYTPDWLKIDDGTNTRLVINTSGNVGIGISNPLSPLHIKGPNGVIAVEGNQSAMQHRDSSGAVRFLTGLRDDLSPQLNYIFHSYGGNWIFNNAKVGIGTGTPAAKLEVAESGRVQLNPAGSSAAWSTIALSSPSGVGEQRFVWIGAGEDGNGLPGGNALYLFQYSPGIAPAIHTKFHLIEGRPTAEFWGDVSASGKITSQTVVLTSDKNQKQDFQLVSPLEVLTKVVAQPVTTWAYTNAPSVRHMGWMAQDFKAAFNLGEDDKHIGAGDGIGVALAAIKGLHELVQEKEVRIAALEKKLAEQERTIVDRLARFEKAMEQQLLAPANLQIQASRQE